MKLHIAMSAGLIISCAHGADLLEVGYQVAVTLETAVL